MRCSCPKNSRTSRRSSMPHRISQMGLTTLSDLAFRSLTVVTGDSSLDDHAAAERAVGEAVSAVEESEVVLRFRAEFPGVKLSYRPFVLTIDRSLEGAASTAGEWLDHAS